MWGKGSLLTSGERGLCTNPDLLLESYRRCETAGVPRDRETLIPDSNPDSVSPLLEQRALLDFARTLFRDAGSYIVGQPPLFLLTDGEARVALLHALDAGIERAARERGLQVGSSLAEENAGTTASGLALRLSGPTVVCGEDHYCHAFREWCCVAVPVEDSHGRTLGVIDVSLKGLCAVGEKLALAYSLSRALTEFHRAHGCDEASSLLVQLTERQQQVLKLFAEGLSYKQIAKQLNVTSRKTIEDHLDAIRVKLGAASRRECIRRAIDLGLL